MLNIYINFVPKGKKSDVSSVQNFNLLNYLIPYYVKEGKTYLSIAFGCTGGRHRSVVLINNLANYLEGKEYKLFVKHRDMNKEEIKIKSNLLD